MGVEFDWAVLEKIGAFGICALLIIFGFKFFQIIMLQWKCSTDAVNNNTEAFKELSRVFERSHERELEFQEHVKSKLQDSEKREIDTLGTVKEIHKHIVEGSK